MLPFVDTYWKGQILKNKDEYMKPHYGGRFFTDYYNKKNGIKDSNEQFSKPIKNKRLLKKIKVCWNMGLCDHGKYSHIKQKMFSIFKSRIFISNSNSASNNYDNRINNLSCRIGDKYDRETVQFQRKKIKTLILKILISKTKKFLIYCPVVIQLGYFNLRVLVCVKL